MHPLLPPSRLSVTRARIGLQPPGELTHAGVLHDLGLALGYELNEEECHHNHDHEGNVQRPPALLQGQLFEPREALRKTNESQRGAPRG